MPWNETDHMKYNVIRERYSRDLSDAEIDTPGPCRFPTHE